MSNPVIELVSVKIRPSVDEADMLRAADGVMAFLSEVRGFIRRELFRAGENQWVDLIYWNSREEAEAAMAHKSFRDIAKELQVSLTTSPTGSRSSSARVSSRATSPSWTRPSSGTTSWPS